jgi:hypothetical protein
MSRLERSSSWSHERHIGKRCHHKIVLQGKTHVCLRKLHHDGIHDAFIAADDGMLVVW